jgi:hypothetical protein
LRTVRDNPLHVCMCARRTRGCQPAAVTAQAGLWCCHHDVLALHAIEIDNILCDAAQVWLLLVNLLVEPACRAKYDADGYR